MAERRMFARSVINSARFLRMPATSRLLYFDLGMEADDDGIVEAFTVMRKTGANEDDLKVLVSKGFVRVLNDDLVSLIVEWKTNNYIQRDRYHPSIYAELLNSSKLYTPCLQDVSEMYTPCIQDVSTMDTQVREGKGSLEKEDKPTRHRHGAYENVRLSDEEYAKLKAEFPADYSQRIERLSEYIASSGKKYKSHLATIRSWARKDGQKQPEGIVLAPLDDPYEAAVREGRHARI